VKNVPYFLDYTSKHFDFKQQFLHHLCVPVVHIHRVVSTWCKWCW